MNNPATDLQLLANRIAKLERQNRFWKIGGVLATLALASLLAIGVRAQEWPRPTQRAKLIEAGAFVLTDANGVTKGEFSIKDGNPVLQLYGPTGKVIWSTNPRVVTQGE
ncbi:MAG TPA: hypothetical protein VI216_11495 [Candidatus Acidoferrales bacterium]